MGKIFAIIIIIIIGIVVSIVWNSFNTDHVMGESLSTECTDLKFNDTIICLNKELRSFHKFNLSNAGLYWNRGFPKVKNWTRIKEEGGVCWHFAQWYVQRARELNLSAKMIVVDLNPNDHAIALISEKADKRIHNYCILDQKRIVGCNSVLNLGKLDAKIIEQFNQTNRSFS